MRASLNLASVTVRLIVAAFIFLTIPFIYRDAFDFQIVIGNAVFIGLYAVCLIFAVIVYRRRKRVPAMAHWFFATLDVVTVTVSLLFEQSASQYHSSFFFGVLYSIVIIAASLSESMVTVIVVGSIVVFVQVAAFLTFGNQDLLWLLGAVYFAIQTSVLAYVARVRKESMNSNLRTKNMTLISPLYRIFGIQNSIVNSIYGTLFVRNRYPDVFVGADFVAAKELEDSLLVIVGDCVGHGTDASQGAKACLVAFHSPACYDTWSSIQTMHEILQKVPTVMGGEAFVLAIRLYENGRIVMEGKLEDVRLHDLSSPEVENSLDKEIETYGSILGRDDVEPKSKPVEVYLNPTQVLVVQTDGARYSDSTDDQTSVTVSSTFMDIGAESDGVQEWIMAGNPMDQWSQENAE